MIPNKYQTLAYKILTLLFSVFSFIKWPRIKAFFNGGIYYSLTESDLNWLRKALVKDHYILLTRRSCHLTTHLISFASFVTTGKASHWTHAVMNVEGDRVKTDDDFLILEAIASGTKLSRFMEVFDCDSVAVLAPKNMPVSEWTKVVTDGLQQLGKPYDNLFDEQDRSHLSCVEVCWHSLKAVPGYGEMFPNLEKMVANVKNLTPQMFYDCPDFRVVFEARR